MVKLIIYIFLHTALLVLLFLSLKNNSSHLFALIISTFIVAVSVLSFKMFYRYTKNTMSDLDIFISMIIVSIIFFTSILIFAYYQKNWFISIPVIIIILVFGGNQLYLKSKKNYRENFTKNFEKNFPEIQQTIRTNNLELFKQQIEENYKKLYKFDYKLYYQINDDKNKLKYYAVLIDNDLLNTSKFIPIIEKYYKENQTNFDEEGVIVSKIYYSLMRNDDLYRIKAIFKDLDLEYKYKYLQDFLNKLKTFQQGTVSKFNLYTEYEEQSFLFNDVNNITLYNTIEKEAYFNLVQLVFENQQYFFNKENFISFKARFSYSLKNNLWDIEETEITTLKGIIELTTQKK